MAGSYEIPEEGSPNSSQDPKIKTMLKGLNESLNSENDWITESIAKGTLGRWYPPTVIATEQERESTSFGTLTTPDEVKNVVLPENGIIVVGYLAKFKSTVASTGAAAIFLGANQLKIMASASVPIVQQATNSGSSFNGVSTSALGLNAAAEAPGADVTTGQVISVALISGSGLAYIFAAAGTYNVSIQYKSTSGKIVAKERRLWVGVIGGT